ncbi:something about silencing protein 10 [Stomoxys calcitrans]|uniref:Sas10 C-terminal domain-containing protein n=1 Tax=Stomoxys calcitrans TaxID=35570 RepID=A0A1I8P5T7_STOCA|nr:something about silencing protein 10 [Stomoxys calcitrans]
MDKIKFRNDDDGQYEPTDSDEEYSEEEKELLQEVRKGRSKNESKQKQVLAFTDSEEEEDDEEHDDQLNEDDEDELGVADSDIEGAEQNDDDLPDTKYWGKKSSAYYNTDFVDQDYSSYNEKEEELAKLEGEEAKAIQLRLAKQLKEDDFKLDTAFKKSKKSKKSSTSEPIDKSSTLLKADFSGLSKRERLELFEKDSPEFSGLIGDFEGYMEEIQQLHAPVLSYVRENKVPMIPALQFAQHYQNIALTYCSNLAFYLLLKANRTSIQNHPIISRLMQLKKLLNQLDDKHENIIKPQLEALLERIQDGDEFEVMEMKNPALDTAEENGKKNQKRAKKSKLGILSAYDDNDEPTQKKSKIVKENTKDNMASLSEMPSDDEDDEVGLGKNYEDGQEGEDEEEEDGENRRGITYQIAKNKGLMPHRKKEQRNPRVKHRGKYRKALIRRKGAVRTVRKETSRYGGEISGIKATVSKSIKFKS